MGAPGPVSQKRHGIAVSIDSQETPLLHWLEKTSALSKGAHLARVGPHLRRPIHSRGLRENIEAPTCLEGARKGKAEGPELWISPYAKSIFTRRRISAVAKRNRMSSGPSRPIDRAIDL